MRQWCHTCTTIFFNSWVHFSDSASSLPLVAKEDVTAYEFVTRKLNMTVVSFLTEQNESNLRQNPWNYYLSSIHLYIYTIVNATYFLSFLNMRFNLFLFYWCNSYLKIYLSLYSWILHFLLILKHSNFIQIYFTPISFNYFILCLHNQRFKRFLYESVICICFVLEMRV